VDAGINQFAAHRRRTASCRPSVDSPSPTYSNKYANNLKIDFLNWMLISAGTFDYAGDGWGYTYGAAAERYQGRWTLRGGIFDLSVTPRRRGEPLRGRSRPDLRPVPVGWGNRGTSRVAGTTPDTTGPIRRFSVDNGIVTAAQWGIHRNREA
jgi:hypothetical protein